MPQPVALGQMASHVMGMVMGRPVLVAVAVRVMMIALLPISPFALAQVARRPGPPAPLQTVVGGGTYH